MQLRIPIIFAPFLRRECAMVETTKLAGTFHARRITLRVRPEQLGDAINRCMELGLLPETCGYLDESVTFRVLVPQISYTAFEQAAHDFHAAVINVADARLVCPPADAVKDRICVRDTVVWNEAAYPMKKRYGDGPFRVVAIHLSPDELLDASAPGTFTIEFYKEDSGYDRADIAGVWFKKPSR